MNSKEVVSCVYDYAFSFKDSLALIKNYDKWGFINKKGEEVIMLKYRDASSFSEGLALVTDVLGKQYFIDKNDNTVLTLPSRYLIMSGVSCGLILVFDNNARKYGYLDKKGNISILPIFEKANSFSEYLAAFSKNNLCGYINKEGKEVIFCKYAYAGIFQNGVAKVKVIENGKSGIINKDGKEIISCIYDDAFAFNSGIAVQDGKKWGYYDINGKKIIPCIYDNFHSFSNGWSVSNNNKWGFFSIDGIEIIPCKYENYYDFTEGMAKVKNNNKYGFVNKSGVEVIPCKYDSAWSFYNDLASVCNMGKWGAINKDGNEVIPCNLIYSELVKIKKILFPKGAIKENVLIKINKKRKEIEEKIKEYKIKGEFEKTVDYKNRMDKLPEITEKYKTELETSQKIFTNEVYNDMKEQYLTFVLKNISLSQYDSDNEVFQIQLSEKFVNIPVKVPINKAKTFKEQGKISIKNAKIELTDKGWQMISCDVLNSALAKDKFHYDITNSPNYEPSKPIDFAINIPELKIGGVNLDIKEAIAEIKQEKKDTRIDVDFDIPTIKQDNKNSFAVIIGNENYKNEITVDYALNDSKMVKKYFSKTFGLPDNNIHYVENATFGQLLSEIEWLNGIAKAFNGMAKLYFYYAGHGIPDEQTKSAYLLPTDGKATIPQTAYKLEELYSKLSQYPTQSVMVFLDAYFSVAARDGMLAKGRGAVIRPKGDILKGNLVVLSATSEDETAFPFKDMQHGLFTYFLLKKIKESKGNTKISELADYIKTNVNQQSIVVNQKPQTPKLNVSQDIISNIETINLK